MSDRIWYAPDLARDLGYPSATPAFWRWCKKVGLQTLPGRPWVFALEDVQRVRGRGP